MTGISSPSKNSNIFDKNFDPSGIDTAMNSSFYSTKNNGFIDEKKCDDIIDSFKVKNVIYLDNNDKEKIKKI